MWSKDPTVWHPDPVHHEDIRNALGWLRITQQQPPSIPRLQALAKEIKEAGFENVLVLDMEESKLCPEVCRMTFGLVPGYPELHVLDSTVPSQVRVIEHRVEPFSTLCVEASKSGSTTEPLVFQKYFFERMRQVVREKAGDHFVVITDPGSLLEQVAKELRFRHMAHGFSIPPDNCIKADPIPVC